MNAHQSTLTTTRPSRSTRRGWGVTVVTTVVVAVSALPAAARQDPGETASPAPATTATSSCPLERVGTQFVACDNLTGNGVPAPAWVPER